MPSSFARMLHEDTERVLAWTLAGTRAHIQRLYPNERCSTGQGRSPGQGPIPNWCTCFRPEARGRPALPPLRRRRPAQYRVSPVQPMLDSLGLAGLPLRPPGARQSAPRYRLSAGRDAASRLGIPPGDPFRCRAAGVGTALGGHALPCAADAKHPASACGAFDFRTRRAGCPQGRALARAHATSTAAACRTGPVSASGCKVAPERAIDPWQPGRRRPWFWPTSAPTRRLVRGGGGQHGPPTPKRALRAVGFPAHRGHRPCLRRAPHFASGSSPAARALLDGRDHTRPHPDSLRPRPSSFFAA